MLLRVKLEEIILREDLLGDKNLLDEIFEMLDNSGLGLSGNGWLDNWNTGQCLLSRHIQEVIATNPDPDICAMKILFTLDDEGLSLLGNGWLDDDNEAQDFIKNEYCKKYP